MDIQGFWDAVLKQDADRMRAYFCRDAYINWHCTDEQFTVEEYIRANCEYPGEWDGKIERVKPWGMYLWRSYMYIPATGACPFMRYHL